MEQVNNNTQYQPPVAPQPQIKAYQVVSQRKTKSKFLTFCCALIPGVGQMYQGLIKRGISIMTIFWGIIAVSVLIYIPVINFALPIVWFFSFFDTVNRMSMPIDELRLVKDEYFLSDYIFKGSVVSNMFRKSHFWIGWILSLVGVYSIVRVFMNRFAYYLNEYYIFDIIRQFFYAIPSMLVPIVCVIAGIKLVMASSVKKDNSVITKEKND